MDNNNEVSVLIQAKAQEVNSSVTKLVGALENVSNKIDRICTSIDKLQNGITKTSNSTRKAKNELSNMTNITNKLSQSFNKAFDVGKMYLYFNVTKRIRDGLKNLIQSSIDYIETQNLFDVSMQEQSKNAYKFMNTMSQTFGIARTQLMEYQASFNNVMKSLPGLGNETSYVLSETLTKMALDYSSVFNVDITKSMEKFQAALVGTVKPIRDKTGLDITEKTLQGVATNIGVEKTVSSLDQVEKRLLRIIALQEQLGEIGAVGDLAKTLESPSNQLKILNEQLKELGVWLGNVFIGTIGKILPYINGFVMALVAVAKALAIFVGYTETKYDNDPLQIEDTTNSVEDLGTSIGSATSKAKELRKQLQGFDVLNIINTPTESSSGSGGGVSGSTTIDPAILSSLKEYDNLMSGVKSKAEEIRDRIMEWLGFTKEIDPVTGEINFKLKEGKTNLQKILNWIKAIGIAIAGLFIIKKIAQIIRLVKDFKTVLGSVKGLKVFEELKFAMDAVAGGAATTGEAVGYLLSKFGKVVKVASGVVLAIDGIRRSTDKVKDSFKDTTKVLGPFTQAQLDAAGGTFELAAGGALIGSNFGPLGIAIGLVAGAFTGLIGTINATNDAKKEFFSEEIENQIFGELEVTSEQLGTLGNQITSTFSSLNTAYDEYISKTESAGESATSSISKLGVMISSYNNLGSTISGITTDDLLGSVKTATQEANNLIDTSSDGIINTLETQWAKSTKLTADEQKEIIKTLQASKKNKKDTVSNIEKSITDIYNNAKNERRDLTQEETKEVENYYKELEKLVSKELDNTNKEIESLTKYLAENNGKISKESWEQINKTLQEKSKQAEELIDKHYNSMLDTASKTAQATYDVAVQNGEDQISAQQKFDETYNKLVADAADDRIKQKNKLNDMMSALDQNYNEDLYSKRTELYNQLYQTDDKAAKERIQAQLDHIDELMKNNTKWAGEYKTANEKAGTEGAGALTRAWNSNIGLNAPSVPDLTWTAEEKGKNAGKAYKKGWSELVSTLEATLPSYQYSVSTGTDGKINLKAMRFFATGGLPDVGQMFVAREAGPELVGTIGNRSAVVNNDQIVQSVSQGVAQAVASVLGTQGGNYNFYLDSQQITAVVTRRQNRNLSVMGV